jgi:hypothetical protein
MEQRSIITLTTDFSNREPFAGIMKGVILKINPSVNIFDITHSISPQNIQEASFVLEMIYPAFPGKTIHIVVVDPGVGSGRRPLLVATDHHYFIGPDNGVFSRIYALTETLKVIHITAEHYFLPERSFTFHGRDIFAPVAAWFSKGIDLEKFGDPVTDYITIPVPAPAMPSPGAIEGEIIYSDAFGNAITNIPAGDIYTLLSNSRSGAAKVLVKGREAPFKKFYSEASNEGLHSLINSFGYLEIFVKGGSASSAFDLNVGEKVQVNFS